MDGGTGLTSFQKLLLLLIQQLEEISLEARHHLTFGSGVQDDGYSSKLLWMMRQKWRRMVRTLIQTWKGMIVLFFLRLRRQLQRTILRFGSKCGGREARRLRFLMKRRLQPLPFQERCGSIQRIHVLQCGLSIKTVMDISF